MVSHLKMDESSHTAQPPAQPRVQPRGLLASVAQLGVSVLGLAENQLGLFANEWETELIW